MTDINWKRGVIRVWWGLSFLWATAILTVAHSEPRWAAFFIVLPMLLSRLLIKLLSWMIKGFMPSRTRLQNRGEVFTWHAPF